MALRPEERMSADALQSHLQVRYGITSSWSGVDPDPPDLRFDITRPNRVAESWAVEVTGLMQYSEWNGDEVNRRIFEPKVFKVCERLNQELGPHMKHSYLLDVIGPFDVSFRDLERRIRENVASGRTEEEALDYPEA